MKELTNELLGNAIFDFLTNELPKRQNNADYYKSQQNVNKGRTVSGRPNNILRSNLCKYITDVHTGYFMGIPTTFDFEDEIVGEQLKNIMRKNSFDELLFSLARDMSIYGTAFCLTYQDADGVKCVNQSPERAFSICDNDLSENVLARVRFSKINGFDIEGEVYFKGGKRQFEYRDKQVTLGIQQDLPQNGFALIEFPNNRDKCGDFYPVLSLMDAYNVLLSGAMDDMQSVANAFLALYGMQGTTREDIDEANRSRVLSLSENGRAEFVVKNVNPEALNSLKKTLMDNMLLVTMTPDLTDETFGNSTSGIAMEYKLWGIEQARSEKQRSFGRSVYQLLEMICRFMGIDCDIKNICTIRFYKNLPQDTAKVCENISQVSELISHKTKLELLPFIEDAGKELQRIEKEKEKNYETEQNA